MEMGNYGFAIDHIDLERLIYMVQGPKSIYILEKVTGESLRDVKFNHFRKTIIGGKEIIVLRSGMSGELGYELHDLRQLADEVYKAVFEAGQEFGIKRLGMRSLHLNHVEACFPTAGMNYAPAFFGHDAPGFEETYLKGTRLREIYGPDKGSYECSGISDMYFSPIELGWRKYELMDFPRDNTLCPDQMMKDGKIER
ncbi:hypothetical protein ACFLYL_00670 [Chloroflexota bacterium]